MSALSHVTAAVLLEPWLIHEPWLDIISGILDSHLAGNPAPKVERKKIDAPWTQAGIDFIPVYGPIAPKMGLLENFSGGTSIADLREHFSAALQNDDSHAICFLFDSPGGNSKGGFEFADEIALQKKLTAKPIIGHVEGDCCSLAYLLASQCDELTMTVGSQAGSIGAFSKLVTRDRQMKNEGVESIVVRSSPLKGIGADAVTSEQMAHMQARIDAMNTMFRSYVMRSRPHLDFSERDMAGVFPAVSQNEALPSAIALGLVDRVSTRDAIISSYGKKSI